MVTLLTAFLSDIIIGFEMDYTTVSEASGVIVVCLKYYNSPSTEEKKLGTSRYEIKVDYQSMNISASMFRLESRLKFSIIILCTTQVLVLITCQYLHLS